jgi:hypothetical protein
VGPSQQLGPRLALRALGLAGLAACAHLSSRGPAPETVRGVVHAGDLPLRGAQVWIAGTRVGTVTDSLGHFALARPGRAVTVRARSIGYQELRSDGVSLGAAACRSLDIELRAFESDAHPIDTVAAAAICRP